MSEPLNIFLEVVEQVVDDKGMSDLAFGMFVRIAWAKMIEAEQAMDEFCKTHHTRPAPVAVKIPGKE